MKIYFFCINILFLFSCSKNIHKKGKGDIALWPENFIQLFFKDYNGNSRVLCCEPDEKVKFLEKKIYCILNIENSNNIFINFYGKSFLNKDKTLKELGIYNNFSFDVLYKIRGGNELGDGFNIYVKCPKCSYSYWINKEGEFFNMGKEIGKNFCDKCDSLLEIKSIGLVNSNYVIDGRGYKYGKAFRKGKVSGKQVKGFNINIDTWTYLEVKVSKIENDFIKSFKNILKNQKNNNINLNISMNNCFNNYSKNYNNSFNTNNYKNIEKKDNSWKFSLNLWPF